MISKIINKIKTNSSQYSFPSYVALVFLINYYPVVLVGKNQKKYYRNRKKYHKYLGEFVIGWNNFIK